MERGGVGDRWVPASPTSEDSVSLVFLSNTLSSYLPLAFSPFFFVLFYFSVCLLVCLFVCLGYFFVFEPVFTV